ncbi:hypothetical protein AB8A21_20590 [Streptomyces sp. BF23-18]|uniref:hypothetical protein n=1 Tax=Streptomyces sp. BF23-18 TaxID=3240282 RepID=UPI0034E57313
MCAEHRGDLSPAGERYAHALEIGPRIGQRWMVEEAESGLARIAGPADRTPEHDGV